MQASSGQSVVHTRENLPSGYCNGLAGIIPSYPFPNLGHPRPLRAQITLGLHARKNSLSQRKPLVGRQRDRSSRQIVNRRNHGKRMARQPSHVEPIFPSGSLLPQGVERLFHAAKIMGNRVSQRRIKCGESHRELLASLFAGQKVQPPRSGPRGRQGAKGISAEGRAHRVMPDRPLTPPPCPDSRLEVKSPVPNAHFHRDATTTKKRVAQQRPFVLQIKWMRRWESDSGLTDQRDLYPNGACDFGLNEARDSGPNGATHTSPGQRPISANLFGIGVTESCGVWVILTTR